MRFPRQAFALACALLLSLASVIPAAAADKTKDKPWTGCFIDGGVAWSHFKAPGNSDSFKFFSMGVGCDYQFDSPWVVGFAAHAEFGDETMLALSSRVGYLLNERLLGYAMLQYRMSADDLSFSDGVAAVGLGVETFLFTGITEHVTAFLEGSKGVSFQGAASGLDDNLNVKLGVRYRF